MKAINQLSPISNCEVEYADEVVRAIEPRAKYMCRTKDYTLLLSPTDEPLDKYGAYMRYLVNGEMYVGLYTNKYRELPKPKQVYEEQMTIFDF